MLQTFVRVGEVLLELNFDCKHTSGSQNHGRKIVKLPLRQLAAGFDVRAKGLCLGCTMAVFSRANCTHELSLQQLVSLDPVE